MRHQRGSLPEEVYAITKAVVERFPGVRVGIHPHNDADLAVANALAAVRAGATHVQGTINGYGERCGNLNLTSFLPTLVFKYGIPAISPEKLRELREVSHFVDERANLTPNRRAPYVGEAAFAHKAGVHVSAVLKNPRTYEHIPPEWVGNQRRFLVSDVSGRSNLLAKLQELGVDLSKEEARRLLDEVKALEYEGYAFEGAEASFYLLAHRLKGGSLPFSVEGFSVFVHGRGLSTAWAEATVRVRVGESLQHTAAESPFGPVSALDRAFRKAVLQFYPELSEVELTDYKVRILSGQEAGTNSGVRVMVEMKRGRSASPPWGRARTSSRPPSRPSPTGTPTPSSTRWLRPGEPDLGEGGKAYLFLGGEEPDLPVATAPGVPVGFQEVLLWVHEPDLGDARLGVEGKLHLPVKLQGGVGHLHEEEDVLRGGEPVLVALQRGLKHHEVRLGLGVLGEAQGGLDGHHGLSLQGFLKSGIQLRHLVHVLGSDGAHPVDLPRRSSTWGTPWKARSNSSTRKR